MCVFLLSGKRRIFPQILYFTLSWHRGIYPPSLNCVSEYNIAVSSCEQVRHFGNFAKSPSVPLSDVSLVADLLINMMFLHWLVERQLVRLLFSGSAAPSSPCLWMVGCELYNLLPRVACAGFGENCNEAAQPVPCYPLQWWYRLLSVVIQTELIKNERCSYFCTNHVFMEVVSFWNIWICQFESKGQVFIIKVVWLCKDPRSIPQYKNLLM